MTKEEAIRAIQSVVDSSAELKIFIVNEIKKLNVVTAESVSDAVKCVANRFPRYFGEDRLNKYLGAVQSLK